MALTLLEQLLAKQEASVSTKRLRELCRWAKEKGHFKDPQLMFSTTEWREIGDSLWEATLQGSKTAKDLGVTWREVMNNLRQMVAEKKMAMAATRLLGSEEPPSATTRVFDHMLADMAKGVVIPMKESPEEVAKEKDKAIQGPSQDGG